MKYTEKSEKNNFDDEIHWSKQYETVEKIGVKGYSQRYLEDSIAEYYLNNRAPVPYKSKDFIFR